MWAQVWSGILFCLFARFVSFAAAFAVVPLFILWLFILFYFLALWLPLKWILSFSSPAGQNMSLLFSPSSVLFAIKLSRFVKYMSQANARAAALCARLLKCAAQREGERDLLFLFLFVCVCGAAIKCYLSLLHVAQCRRAGAAIWLNSCLAAWQLGKTNCKNNCGKAEFTSMFRLYHVFGQITHLMH